MSVIPRTSRTAALASSARSVAGRALRRARGRFASESGFTMIIALGVLSVSTLLVAGTYVAVGGDVHLSQRDLDSKRAYYSARAAVNTYLYQLNQNPDYWKTCGNDTNAGTVPGSTNAETFSYAPIPANGNTACTTDPIASLIDRSTGTLRMKFTGSAGGPSVSRGIVASFRKDSPLDFVWYTVYEALDSSISGYSGCGVFYRAGRNSQCNINWVSGDVINGPMYTQDQYLILGSPTFGRNSSDKIESAAPGTSPSNICSGNSCGSATINGTPVPNAPTISEPTDNSALLTDATNHGATFSGTTTISVDSSTNVATVTNCPSTCTTSSVDITTKPIIYVTNASSCTPAQYSPFGVTYPTTPATGCAGDVYISGSYSSSLTVAAANNIIINGNLTTSEDSSGSPTGTATLGLVANQFVRVMHGCSNNNNVSGQSFSNLKLDASILALQHSFIVDNFDCGQALGTLTINGVIAQNFRGAVGTSGNGSTGYLKNYTYDSRLQVTLPPYLFDIATSGWHLARETLCVPGGTVSATAC
jgi:Tfp pilus assembly protein PilX